MIQVCGLRKRYGPIVAVDGVTFDVRPGEIVGLLGPNGAGKTTIMKTITGYHYPNEGDVCVDGIDALANPPTAKMRIGYLPENNPLYGDLTVTEYLEFAAGVRLDPSEREPAIDRAVAACGLGPVVYRSIDQLSKGYRQRVGLAQAILHDPNVLVLDEPTTGLDPNQILEIRRLIRDFGKKRNKTVLLSTHILQEVEAMCDRVLIVSAGRIAAEGTTEEIGRRLKGGEEFALTLKVAGGVNPAPRLERLDVVARVSAASRLVASDGKEMEDYWTLKVTIAAEPESPVADGDGLASPAAAGGAAPVSPPGASPSGATPAPEAEADGPVASAPSAPPIDYRARRLASAERIFDWAADSGFKILSFNAEQVKLEDIFTRLTSEEGGHE